MEQIVSQKEALARTKGRVTFVKNPIKPFGILFNHGFPLDLSIIKMCFQGCPFCFAVNNRKAANNMIGELKDPTDQYIKLLQKANGQGYNPLNFIEYCIHNKFPIIFSNNVDPFLPASEERYKLGERVLRVSLEYGQKLFIQTKEVYHGEAVKKLIIEGKDLFQMYVSISTLDYEMAKKYETVSISPADRLRKIEELSNEGVQVTAALNPYVPEWQPNLRTYFQTIKDAGCTGVFTYPLHLTPKQQKVTPKSFEPFTKRTWRFDEFAESCKIMEILAKELELGLYYPNRKIFDGYYKGCTAFNADSFWPIDGHWLREKICEAWDEEKNPIMITWDMCDKFYSQFPAWKHVLNISSIESVIAYDTEVHRQVKHSLGDKNSIKNIVRLIWNNPFTFETFINVANDVYLLAEDDFDDKDEAIPCYDDNNNLIYVYDPSYNYDAIYWLQNNKLASENELTEIEFD